MGQKGGRWKEFPSPFFRFHIFFFRGLPMIIQKILDIAQRRAQSMPFTFLELADLADLLVKRATLQNKPPG